MLPAVQGCATLPSHFISVDHRRLVRFDEILREIGNEKVIFVGEGHSREEDHLVQFEVIKYLHEGGKRVAIALEMFPFDMQNVLDQWVKGSLTKNNFERAYYETWNVPYRYYDRIFEFAKERRIPLFGINVNKARIGEVAKRGTGILSEEFRQKIGITTCAQSPEYEKIVGHFEPAISHATGLPFFCEAQLLRDTMMAHVIAEIMKNGDYTVVVLAGSAHALKTAVPGILLRQSNLSSRVLMSRDFRELLPEEPDWSIADYLWY